MSFDKIISEPYTELECQFIMRLPETPAKKLREALHSGNFLKDRLSIKLDNDMRNGEVQFDHYYMRAKVVDMPCIIESLKTVDNKSFYKTADISQMLVCKEEDDLSGDDDEKSRQSKKKDPNKVDKKYISLHGVTPPMKNVRHRRFRKMLRKKHAEAPEIEKEVKRLLRGDCDAVSIKWEIVTERGDSPKPTQSVPIKQESTLADHNVDDDDDDDEDGNEYMDSQHMDVAEHDIFGEALSDSDDDVPRDFLGEDMGGVSMDDTKESNLDSFQSCSDSFITHFSKDMFTKENVYNLKHLAIKSESVESPDDFPTTSRNVKTDLTNYDFKMEDAIDVDYLRNQQSAEDIRAKLDVLQTEINDLKVRRHQQEMEIDTIENFALKQRFQQISARLLTEQLEKEQQYQELSAMLDNL